MTPEQADAETRFNQHDFDGALKRLKDYVAKTPDAPPAEVLLARMFAQAGVAAGVRNSLEKAIVEAPTDPQAYVEMADLLLREGWTTAADTCV